VRGRERAAAAVAAVGLVAVVGCTPPAPSATTPSISAPTASPAASANSPVDSPTTPSSSAATVAVDPALLDLLPADVSGQALLPDAETAAEIAATGELARDIEAIAVGLYVQPGASSADDLAIVNVVRLRPGLFDDGWFRSWRTTYDEGACQVAGGVVPGGAETLIGDHPTHIGSCVGGVHTYHVHLEDPDRVVSITATGEGRFGEQVVAGLTE
jgi:hypothetical protein